MELFDQPGPKARARQRVFGAVLSIVVAGFIGLIIWRLADRGQFKPELWEPFKDPDIQRAIAEGIGATIKAAFFSIGLALILGMLLASGRLSQAKWLHYPSLAIVEFFRAIPLLLLILFLFLGFGKNLGALWSLILGLALYNGAVIAELIRAGVNSVPKGQAEAAMAIGLSRGQTLRMILLPQAIRTMLPSLISQCVVALKDSALGFIIGFMELTRTMRLIYDGYHNIIPSALVACAIYVAINSTLAAAANWVDRRQRKRLGRNVPKVVDTQLKTGAGLA
jgi:glutamate transport system permease protein